MKVESFVDKLNNFEIDLGDYTYVYVPVMKKREIVQDVLNKCIQNTNGYIVIDEFKKEIYFAVALIEEYFKVEFSSEFEQIAKEYDILCATHCLEMLINELQDEYSRMKKLLETEANALLAQNSIEMQIAKVANALTTTVTSLSADFSNTLKEFNLNEILPSDVSTSEFMNIIKMLS